MRMPDPNAPECDCRTLERLSKEPGVPILYDAELNEYRIQTADSLQRVQMHHCFFCGGSLPKSRRRDRFMHITSEESIRLATIIKDIKSLPDLLAALGPPDEENPRGALEGKAVNDDGQPTTHHRVLTYCGLSPMADVRATLHLEDRVQFSFWPKPIGEGKS